MIPDPIVEEVRKVRGEHAAKFHNNIDDIARISLTKSAKSHDQRQSAVQTVFTDGF
jgi:hypothetical protein